jgi:hypothetical protein
VGLYTLQIIPLDALVFTGNVPWSFDNGSGSGWQFENYTFDYVTGDMLAVPVDDGDDSLQDDPANPEWSGGTWTPHSQVLDQDVTVNGTTWPAGTSIENEYEFDAVGSDGLTYRVVGVALIDPNDGSIHVIGLTFDGDAPPPGTTLTSQAGSAQDGQEMAPICFCAGTLIATPFGPRPVETLRPGDLVNTARGTAEPILWVGHRRLGPADLAAHPEFRPVRIAAGSLGRGLPCRDLRLSPQHRIVVRSKIVARMLKSGEEALVAAKHLVGSRGVTLDKDASTVDYHHLMCARHEVILAEGAAAETLLPGREALRAVSHMAFHEITTLFPALPDLPARPVLPGRRARKLAERHRKNGMAFC